MVYEKFKNIYSFLFSKLELLKDNYRISKSIMFCNKSEIEEIKYLLLLKGIDATIVDEDLSEEGVRYLEETWNFSKEGQYTGECKCEYFKIKLLFI